MAEETMQQHQCKYVGKAEATIKGATAEQAWPLLADFCGISRWMPGFEICLDSGIAGEIGCVRHCTNKDLKPVNSKSVGWAKERLTSIDHTNRKLSYVLVENNLGWKHYEATWEVVDAEDGGGCRFEWSFWMEMEPEVDKLGEDPVGPLVASLLEMITKGIEEFLANDGGRGHSAVDEKL